jgi:UDP-glucose 4-epimerase
MRYVITGGAGFIGGQLAASLRVDGADVITIDDLSSESAHAGTETALVEIDAGDTAALTREFHGADAVVHLASSSTIRDGHENTTRDIERGFMVCHSALEAARRAGVAHICLASSASVYGDAGHEALSERSPLRPLSLFGAAKAAGEAFASAYSNLYGLSVTVLRLGNVLGPGLRRGIVFDFVGRLQEDPSRLTVLGNGLQRKPYVDIDDCISAIRTLGLPEHGAYEVYNVASGSTLCALDVGHAVVDALGLEAEVMAEGDGVGWPGDVPVLDLDISKGAQRGWAPRYDAHETVWRTARGLMAVGGQAR